MSLFLLSEYRRHAPFPVIRIAWLAAIRAARLDAFAFESGCDDLRRHANRG
jgi:hypothetical protein